MTRDFWLAALKHDGMYSVRDGISFTFSDAPCYKQFLWLTPNSKLKTASGEIKIEQLEGAQGKRFGCCPRGGQNRDARVVTLSLSNPSSGANVLKLGKDLFPGLGRFSASAGLEGVDLFSGPIWWQYKGWQCCQRLRICL